LNTVVDTEGYWLDYGTLLGAVRGEGIIPYEFDLDMGVLEHDCPKYLALKDKLKEDGLIMYKKGDWVPGKEKSVSVFRTHRLRARLCSG
jgi:lipopolysaccharide cholinephosphotransferase